MVGGGHDDCEFSTAPESMFFLNSQFILDHGFDCGLIESNRIDLFVCKLIDWLVGLVQNIQYWCETMQYVGIGKCNVPTRNAVRARSRSR